MEDLRASYRDDNDDDSDLMDTAPPTSSVENGASVADEDLKPQTEPQKEPQSEPVPENHVRKDPLEGSVEVSSDELSEDNENPRVQNAQVVPESSTNFTRASETEEDEGEDEEEPSPKKQKKLGEIDNVESPVAAPAVAASGENPSETPTPQKAAKSGSKSFSKKSKKKNNNVWTRPTSRKGKKKNKNNGQFIGNNGKSVGESDKVLITPVARFPDKNDDSPDAKICLSKVFKAEKVELSEDRLSAGSIKGYRMVRATRGVVEGAWYFEIKVVHLGETGHTRLGWSMDKGDLQAPVGYDGNSFGYRDIDGSKVHKALREEYGEEGYKEGDVVGFYISLPEGNLYAPDPPQLVWYKGQRFASAANTKEEPPKLVPGSEICFFKNGVCQGTAFKDLYGGRYYPAASMYTLPNQPNCTVKFNFGPDFEFFPEDFGGRPIPRPMIEVPYHGLDTRIDNGSARFSSRMCPMVTLVKEQDIKIVDAAEAIT